MDQEDNVILWELDRPRAQKILRDVAADSGRVIFSDHAKRKMADRKVSDIRVLRRLRNGEITEGPA
jgi:hypothetical protein